MQSFVSLHIRLSTGWRFLLYFISQFFFICKTRGQVTMGQWIKTLNSTMRWGLGPTDHSKLRLLQKDRREGDHARWDHDLGGQWGANNNNNMRKGQIGQPCLSSHRSMHHHDCHPHSSNSPATGFFNKMQNKMRKRLNKGCWKSTASMGSEREGETGLSWQCRFGCCKQLLGVRLIKKKKWKLLVFVLFLFFFVTDRACMVHPK